MIPCVCVCVRACVCVHACVCVCCPPSGVAKARSMAYFGEGQGPIHLDNVRCLGTETSLGQCPAVGQDDHDCRHSEDAGVICDYTLDPVGDGAMAMQTCGLRLNNQRRRRRIIGGDKSLRSAYTHNTLAPHLQRAEFDSLSDLTLACVNVVSGVNGPGRCLCGSGLSLKEVILCVEDQSSTPVGL